MSEVIWNEAAVSEILTYLGHETLQFVITYKHILSYVLLRGFTVIT